MVAFSNIIIFFSFSQAELQYATLGGAWKVLGLSCYETPPATFNLPKQTQTCNFLAFKICIWKFQISEGKNSLGI